MLIHLHISRCNILFCLPTTVRGHKKWVWIFHSCCTSFLPIFPFVLICLAFCPSFLSSFVPIHFYISSFKLLKMEYKWRHCLNKSALHNKLNLAWPVLLPFSHFFRLETLLLDSNFFSQVMLPLLPFRCQRDISYHYWSNHFISKYMACGLESNWCI